MCDWTQSSRRFFVEKHYRSVFFSLELSLLRLGDPCLQVLFVVAVSFLVAQLDIKKKSYVFFILETYESDVTIQEPLITVFLGC
jgi:hypothetical protein